MNEQKSISEIIELIRVLAVDADECEAEMQRTKSELAKRNFVRAIFAWIEAISYLMRQYALKELRKRELTQELIPKILAASEENIYVDDRGEIITSSLKTRTYNNLLFSLKIFAEVFGLSLEINKGSPNWQTYSQALKIRDRITHPKRMNDVMITDRDIDKVREAKGIIITNLQIFLNPQLLSHIQNQVKEAKEKNIQISLTFTEAELERFGIS